MANKVIVNGLNIGYLPPTYSDDILYNRGGGTTTVKEVVDNKVDKEAGKGLFSGSYNDLTNKPTIPTAGTGLNQYQDKLYIHIPRVKASCDDLPESGGVRFREYNAGTIYSLPTNDFYQILEIRSQDVNYGVQLALGMTCEAVYYRNYNNGVFRSWHKLTMS